MTFVTKMTLQSGDRRLLESIVSDIQSMASRKGAELKGPHHSPSRELHIPQHKSLSDGERGRFSDWKYTVYERALTIVGANETARRIVQQTDFPDSIHVEVELEQIQPMG